MPGPWSKSGVDRTTGSCVISVLTRERNVGISRFAAALSPQLRNAESHWSKRDTVGRPTIFPVSWCKPFFDRATGSFATAFESGTSGNTMFDSRSGTVWLEGIRRITLNSRETGVAGVSNRASRFESFRDIFTKLAGCLGPGLCYNRSELRVRSSPSDRAMRELPELPR